MKSSQNTLWVAGAGVLAALLVVASYFLLIAPKRAEAADLADQRAGVEQSNAQLEAQTAQLKAEFATLDEKRAQLAQLQSTLPSDADVAVLLRQLQSYAGTAGVTIAQVTPGTAEEFNPEATASGAAAAASSGIVDIPLTVAVSGTFPQTELFVKNVQADMTRFFLVTGVEVAPDTTGVVGAVTTKVTGKVFVLRSATATTSGSSSASSGADRPKSSAPT